MTLNDIVNGLWKTATKVVCGGVLAAQLYAAPLYAESKSTKCYDMKTYDNNLISVVVDGPQTIEKGKVNNFQVRIKADREKKGLPHKLKNIWVAVGVDNGSIGEEELQIKLNEAENYIAVPNKTELRKLVDGAIGWATLGLAHIIVRCGSEELEEVMKNLEALKEKYIDIRNERVEKYVQTELKGKTFQLFYIPAGKVQGVQGYHAIKLNIPIKVSDVKRNQFHFWSVFENERWNGLGEP